MAILFYLGFLSFFLIITLIKRKKQIGKVWSGPLTARVQIAGKQLCCRHCGENKFQKREGLLVTSIVCMFRFEFWNQSAACYSCIKCGCIEWFVNAVEEKVEMERNPNQE